ncbi:N-acetylmuramoyl-L-alanine amidase [Streptomyces sp. NPDC006872]|uniref:peptidoglycan recognition protein family protein n=1 Tax=Streptomyces sp. NPDC006872 TaxID=3155720 RepID=UPI0033EBD16D
MARSVSPGPEIHRTDFPITAVALSWTGSPRGVRLRLYNRKGKPGAWRTVVPGCPCGKDGPGRDGATAPRNQALVPAGNSYGYQLEAASGVRVTESLAIDTEREPRTGEPLASGTPSARASRDPSGSLSPRPAFPPSGLITRAAWGADETKRFTANGSESSPTVFTPFQMITVHHTATDPDDPDPAATVRAIYQQHAVSNDWGDIGYHFLIDQRGQIYEGRYSGTDGRPAHNARDEVVTAFHTIGFNPGNIGIALLGDFTKAERTPRMQESLVNLTGALASLHGLAPLSRVTYRHVVTGRTTQGPAVAGHRDWTSTDCPGTTAYLGLGRIREQAARLYG